MELSPNPRRHHPRPQEQVKVAVWAVPAGGVVDVKPVIQIRPLELDHFVVDERP